MICVLPSEYHKSYIAILELHEVEGQWIKGKLQNEVKMVKKVGQFGLNLTNFGQFLAIARLYPQVSRDCETKSESRLAQDCARLCHTNFIEMIWNMPHKKIWCVFNHFYYNIFLLAFYHFFLVAYFIISINNHIFLVRILSFTCCVFVAYLVRNFPVA